MKHLTLKEIAKASGYHYTTVARALKDNPLLRKETRLKIQKIAEEMGYRPDPMLQALIKYRHEQQPRSHNPPIAYLSHNDAECDPKKRTHSVPYLDGALHQAEKLGYRLSFFWHAEPGISDRRWSQIFLARNIRMVITANFPAGLSDLKLDWDEFSAVKISVSPAYPPLDAVSCDPMQTVRKAFQTLREKGFRRIAFIYDPTTDTRLGNMWSAGYLVEQQNIPESERIPLLDLEGCNHSADLSKLVQKHRVDAIISYADQHREMLEEEGYRVPEDISYASLIVPEGEPSILSGMRQSYFQVGAAAVTHVTKLHESNIRGFPQLPVVQYIESVWVEGKTVGVPRTNGYRQPLTGKVKI